MSAAAMPDQQPRLKPCPFCGSAPELVEAILRLKPAWRVECQQPGCYASVTAALTPEGAVAAWNRRATDRADAALNEALNMGDGVYRP